jgi:hypothetical protein
MPNAFPTRLAAPPSRMTSGHIFICTPTEREGEKKRKDGLAVFEQGKSKEWEPVSGSRAIPWSSLFLPPSTSAREAESA